MNEHCANEKDDICLDVIAQLFRTYHILSRSMQSLLDRENITLAQMEALAYIWKKPGMTQQELAESLVVTKGNMTGLIDRLTKRGLVERRADAEDRRVNNLFLTDAAQAFMREAKPSHALIAGQMLTVLTEDERTTLRTLLAKMEKAL